MKPVLPVLLLAAIASGCADQAAPPTPPAPAAEPTPAAVAPVPAPRVDPQAAAGGSLRVDAPAPGTITFAGFGPAAFGADAEQVRIAWGGDLGDARPDEPGGCYYLIPQPVGPDGYRTAFMVEGDAFVRIDVRHDDVAAPGGGKVGMTRAQLAALDPGFEAEPHKYTDGEYLRIADPAGSPGVLVFEVDGTGDGAKATTWRIGLAPQVDYVEGCS